MLSTELNELMLQIENVRREMERLASTKGIHEPKVIAVSQMLDRLINDYYKLLKQYNPLLG